MLSLAEPTVERAAAHVLVVDDEAGVRELIVRWLRQAGHQLSSAGDADEALRVVEQRAADVAVLDLHMPGRDGLWLAAQLLRRSPETAVIVATGVRNESSAISSLRSGIVDYLVKPFSRDQLHEAVGRALSWHRGAVADRERAGELEEFARTRLSELQRRLAAFLGDSSGDLDEFLVSLAPAEPLWIEHLRRVAELSAELGASLGLHDEFESVLRRAAMTHDLARLTWPQALRTKNGPLTERQRIALRLFPAQSAALLERAPFLAPAAPIVRARHEHVDGSGYPDGLRADGIPIGSRILAVADTFDTLVKPHWGRPALPPLEAFDEIHRAAGTQFDSLVVRSLRLALRAA